MSHWSLVDNDVIYNSFCLNANLTYETYGIWLISILLIKILIYSILYKDKYFSISIRLAMASLVALILAPIYGWPLFTIGGFLVAFPLLFLYAYPILKKIKKTYPNSLFIKEHGKIPHLVTFILLFMSITYLSGYYLLLQIGFSDFIKNPIKIVSALCVILFYFCTLWAFSSLIEWYFLEKAGIAIWHIFAVNIPLFVILFLFEVNRVYAFIALRKWEEISYCIYK